MLLILIDAVEDRLAGRVDSSGGDRLGRWPLQGSVGALGRPSPDALDSTKGVSMYVLTWEELE